MSAATETIAFLANYNSWRRGDETIEMPSPAEIGATIDDAVNLLRKYDKLERRAKRLERDVNRLKRFVFASWTTVKGLSEMDAKESLMEMSMIAGNLAYWLHVAEMKHGPAEGNRNLQRFAEAISKLEETK